MFFRVPRRMARRLFLVMCCLLLLRSCYDWMHVVVALMTFPHTICCRAHNVAAHMVVARMIFITWMWLEWTCGAGAHIVWVHICYSLRHDVYCVHVIHWTLSLYCMHATVARILPRYMQAGYRLLATITCSVFCGARAVMARILLWRTCCYVPRMWM